MRAVSTTSLIWVERDVSEMRRVSQRRNRSSVKNIGPTSHILRQTHIWTSVSVGDPNLAINHFSPTMKSIEILYHAAASSTLPMFSQRMFNEQVNSTHFIWTSLDLQSSFKFEGVLWTWYYNSETRTHPHQLQIAWAEICQTYPKVFHNLVVFGLVDSCCRRDTSWPRKRDDHKLMALPVSAPWQNYVYRLLTSAACAQELAGPHASKCKSLISNHTQVWRSRTKWYPKYQKGAVHIQVLLGVFGAPGPRRAGESCRPRRCRWLVAGAVSVEERLRFFWLECMILIVDWNGHYSEFSDLKMSRCLDFSDLKNP